MNKKFDFNKLLYPEVKFMNGPYLRNDGRIILVYKRFDGKMGSISYPKYLKEVELNKRLEQDDTIDHIDGNPLNNDLSNLRVIKRRDHVVNDVKRICKLAIKIYCRYCGKEININNKQISQMNRRKTGYFCSRTCSGKYGRLLQLGLIEKKHIEKEKPFYSNQHFQKEMYDWENSEEVSI